MTEEEMMKVEEEFDADLTPEQKAQKKDIMERIEHTLAKLRPYLQAEGGDITLLDFRDGVATVDMIGACAGCMMASVDVSQGIEALVIDEVPEVNHVKLASYTAEHPYY